MRNWYAVHAFARSAGPMHDRRAPRGGSRLDPEVELGLRDAEEAREDARYEDGPVEGGRSR